LFATLQNRHDVAYVYAKQAGAAFNEPLFEECRSYSVKQLKGKMYSLGTVIKVFLKAIKKRIS
jgi:hypothetical protein